MTPKKCMYIAKSLTNTQHMELEPLCTALIEIGANNVHMENFAKSPPYFCPM